jgi:lia operon protein LiaF
MQPSFINRLFWGVVLVGIGIVFLLNQSGLTNIDLGELIGVYWPVILIVFGLQGLFLQRTSGSVWNLIVVMIGVVFLGRNMGWLDWSLQQIFSIVGPVALILFGISMIFKGAARQGKSGDKERFGRYGWNPVTPPPPPRDMPPGPPPAPPLTDDPNAPFSESMREPQYGPHQGSHHGPHYAPPYPENHDPYGYDHYKQDEHRRKKHHHHHHHGEKHHGWDGEWWHYDPKSAQHHRFIGDIHIGQDYWELRPMNISLFIGDTTLDLTRAQIPVGETKIYVACFIGDVKVFVPNDPGIGVQVVSSSMGSKTGRLLQPHVGGDAELQGHG